MTMIRSTGIVTVTPTDRQAHVMTDRSATATPNRGWQSDVIADLIRQFGFAYITLNPGASYRGLHDSLVNHNRNEPPMLLCQHEKIAVQIAHGYAKACGEPLCVIVHNVVGLLHATMGIYSAYTDRIVHDDAERLAARLGIAM